MTQVKFWPDLIPRSVRINTTRQPRRGRSPSPDSRGFVIEMPANFKTLTDYHCVNVSKLMTPRYT